MITKHLGEVQYDKFKKALDDEHMKMFDKILASAVPDFRQKFAGVKMPSIGKIYADGNPVATEVENMQKELKAQVEEYNAKLTKECIYKMVHNDGCHSLLCTVLFFAFIEFGRGQM